SRRPYSGTLPTPQPRPGWSRLQKIPENRPVKGRAFCSTNCFAALTFKRISSCLFRHPVL
ncbi:hypothetical protein MR798_02860, partial [bacterium]|nr:hypothetical protein [bacterium]